MLASTSQSAKLVVLFKSQGIKQTFAKNEYIIHPGETPPGVFYIEEGLVKAFDITKYHEENLLVIRKEEEIFPLIWALTGSEKSVIYQALLPTTVWLIPKEKLISSIEKDPELLTPLFDIAMKMYRLHSQRIFNLEYRTVRERLASFLLTAAMNYKSTSSKDGIKIEIPLKHQDIASSINSSRETASRELASLEKRGIISSKQSYITIIDINKLEKIIS
jgi:CRP-like cAMP-binding protein